MRPDGILLGRRPGLPATLDDDAFRGLALATESTNVHVARGTVPTAWVRGGLRLDAGLLGRGDAYLELLRVLLVDETSCTVRSTQVLGDYTPGPEQDPSAFDWSGRTVTECIHVELGVVFGLPSADADYVVRAVLGPWSSNALRIRVRVER